LGRYLRWQAIIAILGIALLVALLRYTAYNFTSVTVPDKGGTLVEGMAGNPQYLNPLLSQYNQVDAVLCTLLFNGLTRLDQRGDVLPDLAESFAVSPDGLVYDFRLRNGLYWHDGVAVTAGDVLHTVGMMQDTSFPGVSWLSTLWRAVEVTAPEGPDGLAIRFTLEEAYAPFLDYTTIGLLPAHLWEKVPVEDMMASQLNTRPVGTGPFLLTSITATHAELVPNSTFYGPRPYLEGMTIRFYPDHQSLLPAYDRGEIDAVSWIHGGGDDQRGQAAGYQPLLGAHLGLHPDLPEPGEPQHALLPGDRRAPGAAAGAEPAAADRRRAARARAAGAFADPPGDLGE
jgi:peptide/nickel transport system substrate-binding protein